MRRPVSVRHSGRRQPAGGGRRPVEENACGPGPRCEFCEIVDGRAPASKIYEDAWTLAFMDINPVRRGHVLVIPKAHRPQVWDMSEVEGARVLRCLPTLVRAVRSATSADAVDVLNLNGRAGGQSVFHTHFHLIPVHRRRPLLYRKGRVVVLRAWQRTASRAALEAVAKIIRGRLSGTPTARVAQGSDN